MTEIINGKSIANQIESELKSKVSSMSASARKPKLAVIVYNPTEASKVYVNLKLKKAQDIGIECSIYDWSGKSPEQCAEAMQQLAQDKSTDGIIVQLPTNGLDNIDSILNLIPKAKDVDGLNDSRPDILTPATPKAIINLLKYSGVGLANHKIAIIGQGKLVGKPLASILRSSGHDVSTADSTTKDLKTVTKDADIVISAVGKPGLIKGDMIKHGAVVIDAGTSEQNGGLVGDVDYSTVEKVAGKLAKVPGGVGPVTVVSLLGNVVEAAKNPQ